MLARPARPALGENVQEVVAGVPGWYQVALKVHYRCLPLSLFFACITETSILKTAVRFDKYFCYVLNNVELSFSRPRIWMPCKMKRPKMERQLSSVIWVIVVCFLLRLSNGAEEYEVTSVLSSSILSDVHKLNVSCFPKDTCFLNKVWYLS